jgi:hypothetical protein
MRADWILAVTAGGVEQAIEQLPFERIRRPALRLDKDMVDPDLSARPISIAGEKPK